MGSSKISGSVSGIESAERHPYACLVQSEERIAAEGKRPRIGHDGASQFLNAGGLVDVPADAEGRLMFLYEVPHCGGANVDSPVRTVAYGVVRRVVGNQDPISVAS